MNEKVVKSSHDKLSSSPEQSDYRPCQYIDFQISVEFFSNIISRFAKYSILMKTL